MPRPGEGAPFCRCHHWRTWPHPPLPHPTPPSTHLHPPWSSSESVGWHDGRVCTAWRMYVALWLCYTQQDMGRMRSGPVACEHPVTDTCVCRCPFGAKARSSCMSVCLSHSRCIGVVFFSSHGMTSRQSSWLQLCLCAGCDEKCAKRCDVFRS